MTEWKPIKTAPCDKAILLVDENRDIEVGFYKKRHSTWYYSNGYKMKNDPVAWQELPEPPAKKHYCLHGNFECSYVGSDLVLSSDDGFILFVDYCPFCGYEDKGEHKKETK